MVAVPFVYFSALLFYQLKKNKWRLDIACFILVIYAVSGFFSILIDIFDLRYEDQRNYIITPWATMAYCCLLTLCVLPFMKYSNILIKEIRPIRGTKMLKVLAWIFFLYFFINFVFSFGDILSVATADDLSQVRGDHYKGDDATSNWWSSFPLVARFPFIFLGMSSSCTWIFIFLAFYCRAILKMPYFFFILFLCSSINGLIENFLDGGRSAIAYWIISFFACLLFFRQYMSKKDKKRIFAFSSGLLFLFALFLIGMTISRFSERDAGDVGGTQGGIITYFGQSFINFCFFFDSFRCPIPSLQIVFPFLHKILLGDAFLPVVDLQNNITLITGYNVGIFYTFLGHICVTSHPAVAVFYGAFLSFLSYVTVRKCLKIHVGLSICYFYLLYSSVLFLGVFTHYYAGMSRTFPAALWGIILYILSRRSSKLK